MSQRSVPHEPPAPQGFPQTDTPTLAAIYARVSTTEQADKGYSLPTQIEACQALAQREGYTVPESHVFVDDYTGTSMNRPQFKQLRDLVQHHRVKAVFAYDLDRLSRKLAHQLLLTDELDDAGVALHIVTMPATEKTPEAQLFTNIRGSVAEYDRAKILERTRRGLQGRAQAGHPPAGVIPFGYRYGKHDAKGGHYLVAPDEAAIVQDLFRWYVRDELTLYALAQRLTQTGVQTPWAWRGKGTRAPAVGWQVGTVRSILRNEAYTGTLYYGKTHNLPGKSNPDRKTRHQRTAREDWIPIDVPPLIDQATFAAAQARLTRNRQQSYRNRKYGYLFINGRLRCGQCGRGMSGYSSKPGVWRYRCTDHPYQAPVETHGSRSCLAAPLEADVWRAVERALHTPALIAAEVERQKEGTSARQADLARERHHYTRQIAQCDKDLKRWEAAYLGEAIDLGDFKVKKAEVDVRRASAEQELARLDAEQRAIEQAELETASLMDYCARVRAQLQQFTLEEKQRALEALNITVIWHPGAPPEIHGSIPVDIETSTPWCIVMPCAMR